MDATQPEGAGDTSEGVGHFAAALSELERELDWGRLGALYCYEGGEHFFTEDALEAQREAGLELAAALGEALGRLPVDAPRRSLYVGAALGELLPMLFEALVLEREVHWVNLAGAEMDELARALGVVEERIGVSLVSPRCSSPAQGSTAELWRGRGPFDHLWMASVLTDPEGFPALHDELYQRRGAEATGRGNRAKEEACARELVREVVAAAADRTLLATTEEELPFFLEACEARSIECSVAEVGRLTAIVGDVLRFARLTRRA